MVLKARTSVTRWTGTLALVACVLLPACGGDDGGTSPTPARTFEQTGCTTLRFAGQDTTFNFDTVCRTGGLQTVTLGGSCTVIVGCLSNRCLAGCATGTTCSCS